MSAAKKRSWTYYIGVLGLLYAVVCLYFYLIQEISIFPARKIPVEHEFSFSLPHQELFIDAPDGARLNGVLFRAREPQGVVLHFHGNAENMLDMEFAARPFIKRNFDFLATDYRGYGKSTGDRTEQALFDDAELFVQYLEDLGWQQPDIIIYGRSIGTGIAVELASRTTPRGLLLYAPFYSVYSMVTEQFPFLPVKLILNYPMRSDQSIQSVDAPVLILHGDNDNVIPYNHSVRLADIKGELVTINGGGHNNLTRFSEFWSAVDQFLSAK